MDTTAAIEGKTAITGWREALAYLNEGCGRKVAQTKLFEDIKKGLLKKQTDGSFKPRDLDRYAASLPTRGTSDSVAKKAADRLRRKEEADIRRAEAIAEREEFDLQVKKGKFIPREQVYQELAARAVTLASGLKTAFEARVLELVEAVDGSPKKAAILGERLDAMLDEALGEYSREMEFEVTVTNEHAEQPQE